MLGRGTLMDDEIGIDRLEHQPLRCGHLSEPNEVVRAQNPEVGMWQETAFERPLAGPHDVRGEVDMTVLVESPVDFRVVLRALPGEDEKLLDVALRRAMEDPLHLLRRIQMRLV